MMPRDADSVLGMDLLVMDYASSVVEKSELLDDLNAYDLTFLLETEDGARGLVVLDLPLVASIIEAQVSGTVTNKAPPERAPTRTDAHVVAEIVDKWLQSFADASVEGGFEASWPFQGFRRVPGPVTARDADLLLEPVEFCLTKISVSLGGGAKTGSLRMMAPPTTPLLSSRAKSHAELMRAQLPNLQVTLEALLARLPMTMAKVDGLKTDDILPLPADCLTTVTLIASGKEVFKDIHLGELSNKKAVKIIDRDTGPGKNPENADQPAPLPPPADTVNVPPIAPSATEEQSTLPEPTLPELPDLPDLPKSGTEPEANPALPNLPDLPDLPELP